MKGNPGLENGFQERRTYSLCISANSEAVSGNSFPIINDDMCIAAISKFISILFRSIFLTRWQTDSKCLEVMSIW